MFERSLLSTLSHLASGLFKVKKGEMVFAGLNKNWSVRQGKTIEKNPQNLTNGQQSINYVTRLYNTLQSYFHVCSKMTVSISSRKVSLLAALLPPKPPQCHSSTYPPALQHLHKETEMAEIHTVNTGQSRHVAAEPGSISIYLKLSAQALIWALSIRSAFS